MQEELVYEHILIPSDGSALAQSGVDQALALAKQHGARVTVVTVTEPFGGQFAYAADLWSPGETELADYENAQSQIAGRILEPIKRQADHLGVEAETIHVPGRLISGAILEVAEKAGCSLIVMSSHGRTGISRAILGSQTSAVLGSAKVPVLVVR